MSAKLNSMIRYENGYITVIESLKSPQHCLYTKGWPTCLPTQGEAELLAEVRADVASAVGLRPTFTRPAEIVTRYEHLLAAKARRAAA